MLNLLVAVEHNLASSFALRTVCLIDLQVRIQPFYVIDPPGRDISLGAGWAWNSWERETRQRARSEIEDLVLAERSQCTNIEEPIVATGDPVHVLTRHFWENRFDLLVVGTPFREWGPRTLSRRFWQAARKSGRDLPLLLVRHLKSIRRVVVLTDGSEPARKALDLFARLYPLLSCDVSLVGLVLEGRPPAGMQRVDLENAAGGLKARGIAAAVRGTLSLGGDELRAELKTADLVVSPFLDAEHHSPFQELLDHAVEAGIFYMAGA
jgi:hypothetical protein